MSRRVPSESISSERPAPTMVTDRLETLSGRCFEVSACLGQTKPRSKRAKKMYQSLRVLFQHQLALRHGLDLREVQLDREGQWVPRVCGWPCGIEEGGREPCPAAELHKTGQSLQRYHREICQTVEEVDRH